MEILALEVAVKQELAGNSATHDDEVLLKLKGGFSLLAACILLDELNQRPSILSQLKYHMIPIPSGRHHGIIQAPLSLALSLLEGNLFPVVHFLTRQHDLLNAIQNVERRDQEGLLQLAP